MYSSWVNQWRQFVEWNLMSEQKLKYPVLIFIFFLNSGPLKIKYNLKHKTWTIFESFRWLKNDF